MFVLISTMMDARNAIAVYSTREKAERYKEHIGEGNLIIEEHPVQGNYEFPADISVAHRYDASNDVYMFVGLFADFGRAYKECGEHPHILTLTPDSRVS
jgi:hypothetical protein